MTIRAAIYARVSSAAQRDAHTVESQLHVLRPYIAAQGWTLVETYIDDGRSAKTGQLDRRDAFHRLVRDAEAKRFDAVVVVDIDRLTRTEDMIERAEIFGRFQRCGVDIVTPKAGRLDLRTMFGQLSIMFDALRASEDNRRRSESIKAGKLRAIAAGRKPAGTTPYGLAFDRLLGWSLDPDRAPIVGEIFRRIVEGDSCETIAAALDDRDVPAPARGQWTRRKVWGIARSRHVIGEWIADKTQRLTVTVPVIIDAATWSSAQDALIAHGKRGLVQTRHVYLLEGLAVCGACGRPIGIRSASNVRATPRREAHVSPAAYVCLGRKDPARDAARCYAPILPTAEVDERVWVKIEARLASSDLARDIRDRIAARAANRRDWKRDAAGYRGHLARLVKVETGLLARFRRGAISGAAMDVELAAIERERAAVRRQLEAAENAASGRDSAPVANADEWTAELRELARSVAPADRQRVVRAIVRRGGAVFDRDEIRIDLTLERGEFKGNALASSGFVAGQCDGLREPGDDALTIQVVA